jgi:hypothetical protein
MIIVGEDLPNFPPDHLLEDAVKTGDMDALTEWYTNLTIYPGYKLQFLADFIEAKRNTPELFPNWDYLEDEADEAAIFESLETFDYDPPEPEPVNATKQTKRASAGKQSARSKSTSKQVEL